ncbi:hypothetical protein [Carnimonas bestiolae]|uniref:hypothetical protein n=1 Tax=Carnimonas bestiolae TaxID=3402172 RepID=UPI003EDBD5BD
MAAFTWPDTLRPQSQTLRCHYNNFAWTSALSNAQQIYGFAGAYWECEIQFDVLSAEQERELTSLLGRLGGMAGTCLIPDFVRRRAKKDLGNVQVSNGKAQSQQLGIKGLPSNKDVFKRGDYVSVNGELFEILEDIRSGNNGTATLPINRRIRANIAAGQPVEYYRPVCEMRCTSDVYDLQRKPVISSLTIGFREAF